MVAPELRIATAPQAIEQPPPLHVSGVSQQTFETAEARGVQRDRDRASQRRQHPNLPSLARHFVVSATPHRQPASLSNRIITAIIQPGLWSRIVTGSPRFANCENCRQLQGKTPRLAARRSRVRSVSTPSSADVFFTAPRRPQVSRSF
jgi:hypothetical protein